MKKTKVLIPVYNDWQSVFKLLENIDREIDGWEANISVLIINDASSEKKPSESHVFKNLKSLIMISLNSLKKYGLNKYRAS